MQTVLKISVFLLKVVDYGISCCMMLYVVDNVTVEKVAGEC